MTDEEALEQAKAGREAGFIALYARYARYLFTVALRILGHREWAEDALQETFTAAFRSLREFQGKSRLKTWLFTILFRTSLRLRERMAKSSGDDLEAHEFPGPDLTGNIDQRLLVEQTMALLPARDRAVLIMAYWDDLTCAEIGEVLGIKENHVKILLFRARNRFGRHWPEIRPKETTACGAGGEL